MLIYYTLIYTQTKNTNFIVEFYNSTASKNFVKAWWEEFYSLWNIYLEYIKPNMFDSVFIRLILTFVFFYFILILVCFFINWLNIPAEFSKRPKKLFIKKEFSFSFLRVFRLAVWLFWFKFPYFIIKNIYLFFDFYFFPGKWGTIRYRRWYDLNTTLLILFLLYWAYLEFFGMRLFS